MPSGGRAPASRRGRGDAARFAGDGRRRGSGHPGGSGGRVAVAVAVAAASGQHRGRQRVRARRLVLVQPAAQRRLVVRRSRARAAPICGSPAMSPNMLHFDGGRWTSVRRRCTITEAIWGASENDVWFGGQLPARKSRSIAAIAHWDGTAVTADGEFGGGRDSQDIWGSSANDVYAVGFADAAKHWNGSAWTVVPGIAGTERVGVGPERRLGRQRPTGMSHFDGAAGRASPESRGGIHQSVSVAGPGDVWAVDVSRRRPRRSSTSMAPTGASASSVASTTTSVPCRASTRRRADHVWLVGVDVRSTTSPRGYLNHFDGSAWTRGAAGRRRWLFGVRTAPGIGDIAVGQNGGILQLMATRRPGSSTCGPARPSGCGNVRQRRRRTCGRSADAGHRPALRRASRCAVVPAGTSANLTDVWGTAPDDVWAVGQGGTVVHYDGSAFASRPVRARAST